MNDPVEHRRVELDGRWYAIVALDDFVALCQQAGRDAGPPLEDELALLRAGRLAERLRARRKEAGLTQAELARRAGIRPETLNRIERGKVEPDFATVRKLVEALQETDE